MCSYLFLFIGFFVVLKKIKKAKNGTCMLHMQLYLVRSEVKEEGRVLRGEDVVGVTEGAWSREGAWSLGAEDEKSSQAEMTRRLCVSFSSCS